MMPIKAMCPPHARHEWPWLRVTPRTSRIWFRHVPLGQPECDIVPWLPFAPRVDEPRGCPPLFQKER